jgi:predicted permease
MLMRVAFRVHVGGGRLEDGLQQLLQHPPLWAVLLSLALKGLGLTLPTALDATSASLAPINKPLMLLMAGMTLSFDIPAKNRVGGVV